MDYRAACDIVAPTLSVNSKAAWRDLSCSVKRFIEINPIAASVHRDLLALLWEIRKNTLGRKFSIPESELESRWNETVLKGVKRYAKTNRAANHPQENFGVKTD